MTPRQGTLFVVSAPSGAGKHSILQPVLARNPNLVYSISATTRSPRPGEVDGEDYHFLEQREFCRRIEDGEFAEWAHVHGQMYGTLKSELEQLRASGKDVILELDVQGMRNLKGVYPDAVTVFIMAPTLEQLENRLRSRGTDSEENIRLRLRNAELEIAALNEYDYLLINEDLDTAIADMEGILHENSRSES